MLTKIDQSDKVFGSGPMLKYIVAGDSAAVGQGASSLETSFAYKVAVELSKKNTINYKNIAVIGNRTKDIINNQLAQIIEFQPDIVVISISGNDATHLVSEKTLLKNYTEILTKLQNKTAAKIYITATPNFTNASILPWFYIKLLEFRSSYIIPKILKLENDRVKIIDIHNFGWENYPNLKATFATDHFHPNDLGYQNWTNAFLDKITKP